MRLRMLKLSVGKGHQVMKQLGLRVLQYYAIVATERTGYVLYRALVGYVIIIIHVVSTISQYIGRHMSNP